MEQADLVITNTAVYTMDAARRRATALAIRGGRIIAVGSDADVGNLAGPGTRTVDLRGRMVLPGFQDAHVHPCLAGLERSRCDLHDVYGREAYAIAVREYADSHPDEAWIRGGGWYMDAFPRGVPNRSILDDVVPDRPVFLTNRDGHGAWVNSKALELAGVTRDTPDPSDGRIERDSDGEPWGTLHEGAMELVGKVMPEDTQEEFEAGILNAQEYLQSLGITAWQDAWVTPLALEAYRSVAGRGALTSRVVAANWWERHEGLDQIDDMLGRRERGSVGRLSAATVKIMQDGVLENYTGAMIEAYLDERGRPTGNRGLSQVDPAVLKAAATRLDREGFQVHIHAIGDRAVREGLDAFEAALAANGPSDGRHHIAHIQVVHPDDIPRFRRLNVTANAQPFWACYDGQMVNLTIPFLGPERSGWQYPFGSLRRAGARLAFGSDWFVSTPNPLLEIEVAVNRVAVDDRGHEPFLPDERLDLATCLEAFTINSAYVNHLDTATGSLEAGKLADLVVLDQDLFEAGERPIGEAKVLLTMIEGEAVFADTSFEQWT